MARYRLGTDIGGTFTDFILVNDETGEIHVHKSLTTRQPEEAILSGVEALADNQPGFLAQTEYMVHATTLVINAVIERKGAKTGLLMTKGFRDVLEMRRHLRPATFDMWTDPPAPLVDRRLRRELNERIYSDGEVLIAADAADIAERLREFQAAGVESIAVCLLHSYVNPAHEQLVRTVAQQVSPSLVISLSSEVLPEIKEYERTSTTAVNAYTRPLLERYLARLAKGLEEQGLKQGFVMLHSGGGIVASQTAIQFPVRVIESGPAAGAIAAQYYGQKTGIGNILAFDMGGTTAKACLIRDGILPITSDFEVDRAHRFRRGSGFPVAVPSVDLIEIGAGGGSIARLNSLGLVQVGPQSAGANPGPVCYGRGGEQPTVTDADLVLGYLNPAYFLGGAMGLTTDVATAAVQKQVGAPKGWDGAQAAAVVHEVVNENMAAAITQHVVEKGGDPSAATLFAFGGAGPVHAFNLARKLQIRQVLVPQRAGVMSALGMLMAPPTYDLVHTFKVPVAEADLGALQRLYIEMQAEATAVLRAVNDSAPIRFVPAVDMCYTGQGYSITLSLPDQPLSELDLKALSASFREQYQNRYGYATTEGLEFVRLRVSASADVAGKPVVTSSAAVEVAAGALPVKGSRSAWSVADGALVPHTVYDRYGLAPGMQFAGPAIVEERESTTVVGPGAQVRVDELGTLVISL